MATEWVQMRSALLRSPKVLIMCRWLDRRRAFMDYLTAPAGLICRERVTEIVTLDTVVAVTISGLLVTWSEINDAIDPESSSVRGMVLEDIDNITKIPHFGEAMALPGVEWVVAKPGGGLIFPHFEQWNIPAKAREKRVLSGAERQANWRARQRLKNGSNASNESDGKPNQRKGKESTSVVNDHKDNNTGFGGNDNRSATKGAEPTESLDPYLRDRLHEKVSVSSPAECDLLFRIAEMPERGLISQYAVVDAAEATALERRNNPIGYFRQCLQNSTPNFENLLAQVPKPERGSQ